jgi:hypothetical protein
MIIAFKKNDAAKSREYKSNMFHHIMGNAGSSTDVIPEERGSLVDTFPQAPWYSPKGPKASPKNIPLHPAQSVRGYSSSAHAIKYLIDTAVPGVSWSAENIYENACAVMDERDCRVSLWDCVRGVSIHGMRSEDADQEAEPGKVRFMRIKRKDVIAALTHGMPVACVIDPVRAGQSRTTGAGQAGGAVAACLLSSNGLLRVFCHDPVDLQFPVELLEDETAIDCFWCVKNTKVPVSKCVVEDN